MGNIAINSFNVSLRSRQQDVDVTLCTLRSEDAIQLNSHCFRIFSSRTIPGISLQTDIWLSILAIEVEGVFIDIISLRPVDALDRHHAVNTVLLILAIYQWIDPFYVAPMICHVQETGPFQVSTIITHCIVDGEDEGSAEYTLVIVPLFLQFDRNLRFSYPDFPNGVTAFPVLHVIPNHKET